MKRVVVVGSDGTLGGTLAQRLGAAGVSLRCPPGAEEQPAPGVGDAATVVNAAGPRVRPGLGWQDYFREHVGTASRIARSVAKGSHLVHLSSTAVYGARGCLLTAASAEAPLRFPNASYACAKLASELAVREICRARGVGLTVLRLSTVYGAGVDNALGTLARLAARGFALRLAPATARQHWLHASLLHAAVARLAGAAPQGLLLLADPFVLTSADFWAAARKAGRRAVAVPVPVSLARQVAARWPKAAEPPGALAAFAVLGLDNEFDWQPAFSTLGLDPAEFARARTFDAEWGGSA